jgi:hypothetical protein
VEKVLDDRRSELAEFVTRVNSGLVTGNFEMDWECEERADRSRTLMVRAEALAACVSPISDLVCERRSPALNMITPPFAAPIRRIALFDRRDSGRALRRRSQCGGVGSPTQVASLQSKPRSHHR